MNPTQLPTDGTLPLLVLQIIAVSGEFPAAFSGHFPGGCSYIESVIGKLKKDGLLRSYTKNGLRGLRLTASAKQLLLQKYPFDLAPYLTGTSETNSLKSEPERRLRLHRMAEALLILHNAQIPSLPWEKPCVSFRTMKKDRRLPALLHCGDIRRNRILSRPMTGHTPQKLPP